MSGKTRSIETKFWSDGWVRKLNALDRYIFIYLLTNEHSSWCGVYELDLSMAAFESGVDERDLENSILPRLSEKIVYVDGWVYIKNFEKYHSNGSPTTKKGIEVAWEAVPEQIRLKIAEIKDKVIPHGRGMQGGPSLTSSSSFTSTLTSSFIAKTTFSPEGAKIMEKFIQINPSLKYNNKTQRKACDEMIRRFGLEEALGMVDRVLGIQGKQFAPTATTPHVMWQKIGDFAVYFKKKEGNSKNIDL